MWWPGSTSGDAGADNAEPSSESPPGSAADSEVMEILSEEDMLAVSPERAPVGAVAAPATTEEAELRDLKEQFTDQEKLLGQLKNVLK